MKKVDITLTLSPDVIAALFAAADADDTSKSAYVNRLLRGLLLGKAGVSPLGNKGKHGEARGIPTVDNPSTRASESEKKEELLTHLPYHKEASQRQSQVKREYVVEDFETWWKAYPNKTGKLNALAAWGKIPTPRPSLELMLDTLKWQCRSKKWTADGGKYIPHPTTYIHRGSWADEPTGIIPTPRPIKQMSEMSMRRVARGLSPLDE